MQKLFDQAGQLNLALFDPHLLQATNNLGEVLAAAARTQSAQVESTHFLIALTRIPAGLTQQFFRIEGKGIAPEDMEAGLAQCATQVPSTRPPDRITSHSLDASAQAMMTYLEGYLDLMTVLDEGWLLLATLEHLTPAVIETFQAVHLNLQDLIAKLRDQILKPFVPPKPFDDQTLSREAFSPGAWRVLDLMRTEAQALGYAQIDPRHLLLALLEYDGGATQLALYQQDIVPRRIQERVMINLQARASKTPSRLDLDRDHMNFSLIQIIERAAEETRPERDNQIAEAHLLRAFLNVETFALRLLADTDVSLDAIREVARQFKPEDEAAPSGSSDMKPWETLKANLEAALVGQQDAVGMCLPFIRRMHFGFRRPGKPAGVFLFCGPSGSGKTEMAKAMARAVFGSEESLIMLEMGQFQTKESMNIFVGAPPGYVGYGQGKLTNGLRDRPRSVVLFDEVEKANPEVFDVLLRFLDEGRIDDPAGPVRDGSECIIVLTSNVRTEGMEKLIEGDSYQKNKWEIRRELKKALLNRSIETKIDSRAPEPFRFRPEFLNRIDEIILFRTLDERDLTEIARLHLVEYADRLLDEKQITLVFVPKIEAVARLIGHFCATIDEGARATLRIVQTSVVDPVIDFVYDQSCPTPISLDIHFPQEEELVEPRGIISIHQA